MLTAERRQYILDILRRDKKVLSSELSTALNVSEDTIRRDLRELAESGLLQRVHGGALLASPAIASYADRQKQAPKEKEAIARAAAKLVCAGQVVILDGGTTTLQVACHLPLDLQATVVTNSPPIAVALADHPYIEVVMLGGQLYKKAIVNVGAATVEALRMIRADLCMLGVCSLHPEIGISVTNLNEAYVKRAMIARAAEVVGLATAAKLDTAASYVVESIHALTYLVTASTVSDRVLAAYKDLGLAIVREEDGD
ncbi:DeoR family transcriptional regulator [Chroococcidiopsis sp. CCALA 051]|uniref:DeoR/GlpR family DNA-binding transcription regulator n=1 Tax=Chroococcidiopsis sp. CCALA 051 TaxID=869949 RepID=UPI000D0DC107|nr:DeoR/GlpR family DNA-binding transcription regulator [Chroococcidiopsis sp. CCALA 051]MBE9016399.1 DeoR/GlpR transcriptional regulator [Chroococcidiopsidales cyanobacterium LEGE 13417]PSM49992.1 DeoR family transcriptional regulator [Chroococcidiopsis sp. CCALA 051]